MQTHEIDKKAAHERLRMLKQHRMRSRDEKQAGRAGPPDVVREPAEAVVQPETRTRGGGASWARGAATRAPGTGTWSGETSTYTVLALPVLLALLAHKLYAPCREELRPVDGSRILMRRV